MGDLFFDRTILVPGSAGTEEETHFNQWVADNSAIGFQLRNGGVHRGGIAGENSIELAVVSDNDLTEDELLANNLILFGTHATNSILARFAGDLPLAFEGETIRLSGRSYSSDHAAVFALFPHPRNPGRYVAVHGSVTPDAHSWGSHLGMQLLPDWSTREAKCLTGVSSTTTGMWKTESRRAATSGIIAPARQGLARRNLTLARSS